MADINVENDLQMVADKIKTLSEDLVKIENARNNLITNIQNLNGVIMYLRGKQEPSEDVAENIVGSENTDIEVEGGENIPPEVVAQAKEVIKNKLGEKKYQSDNLVSLHKLSVYYIENYDFSREIQLLSKTYSDDPNRLKNIRLVIIQSLNDRKLIEKFQIIINKL